MFLTCEQWAQLRLLTVSVLIVHTCDLPIGQDLDMEADAHITVKSSQSFDPQQVFSIARFHLPLVPGAGACTGQRHGTLQGLCVTADNWERSEGAAQEDPIQQQGEQLGPGWWHPQLTATVWFKALLNSHLVSTETKSFHERLGKKLLNICTDLDSPERTLRHL